MYFGPETIFAPFVKRRHFVAYVMFPPLTKGAILTTGGGGEKLFEVVVLMPAA